MDAATGIACVCAALVTLVRFHSPGNVILRYFSLFSQSLQTCCSARLLLARMASCNGLLSGLTMPATTCRSSAGAATGKTGGNTDTYLDQPTAFPLATWQPSERKCSSEHTLTGRPSMVTLSRCFFYGNLWWSPLVSLYLTQSRLSINCLVIIITN